jgi:hypothetical protein
MACSAIFAWGSAQKDTRKGVFPILQAFQRQALYPHFLHGVPRFQGIKMAFGGCVFLFPGLGRIKREKQGQVEQQMGEIASCFLFSLSLLLSKSNAYFEDLRDLADELLS